LLTLQTRKERTEIKNRGHKTQEKGGKTLDGVALGVVVVVVVALNSNKIRTDQNRERCSDLILGALVEWAIGASAVILMLSPAVLVSPAIVIAVAVAPLAMRSQRERRTAPLTYRQLIGFLGFITRVVCNKFADTVGHAYHGAWSGHLHI